MNRKNLLAGVVVLLAAIAALFYFWPRTSSSPAVAEQSEAAAAPEPPATPAVAVAASPEAAPEAAEPVVEPVAETAVAVPANDSSRITGRVFDRTTSAGISGVAVTAEPHRRGSTPVPPMQGTTDADGRYEITGLWPGQYQVHLAEVPGYPMTKSDIRPRSVGIMADDSVITDVDFSLARSGTLTGRIAVNGEPMANMNVLIDSQPGLEVETVTSDANGNYRIEGIGDYSGSLRARGNVFGTRRGTPYVAAVVKSGMTTTADFDFIAGTSSIVGDVFWHKRDGETVPVGGNLVVTYAYVDSNEYNIENMDMRVGAEGHFVVEGLWGGRATIGLYPEIPGVHRHRYSFALKEGEQARQDFHFYDTRIDVRIGRMPADRELAVWLVAIPGHVQTPEGTPAAQRDFVESQQRAVGGVKSDGTTGVGSIGGLPPGDYTIMASGILGSHTLINHAAGDEFYRRRRTVRTFVTLPEDTGQLSIEMNFPEEP